MRVGGDPSPGVEVDRPVERELDVARRGVHLEPRPRRRTVEPADDLDIDPAGWQLDGESAGDVGIGRRPEDEVAAGVLEERRVDLVAMADRRQVAPVGGREADPARDRFAGCPVHDLDLDRDARRRQRLDRAGPGGIAPRAAGQQLGRRHVPVVEADDGVPGDRQVDHAGSRPVVRAGRPRPAPTDDPPLARAVGRLVRGHRPDDRSEVDLGRPTAQAIDPDGHARAADQRVGGAPVDRHGGQDDVAPRPTAGQRLETEGDGFRLWLELDRVEPQEHIATWARHEVGHPDLVAAVCAGHDRERPRLAGRGVAARPLGGVRPTPVQDLVLEMRDRGERAGAPAEDPLVDLEPAPDEPGRRPTGPVDDRVPGERLADRHDVPDGETVRPSPGIIAPGIAQVGDDDVAGRPVARQVDLDRRAEQDPALRARGRAEVEGQAVEDRPTGRQPFEGGRVAGLEAVGHLRGRGIPAAVDVDAPGAWAGAPHPGARRPAGATTY